MVLEPLARRGWPGDRNEGSCGGVTCCPSAFLPKAAPGCCLMARPWEAGLCSLGGTRAPGTGCEAGSSVPSEAAVGPGQAEDWPSTCADDGCERRGLGRDLPGVPQATWLTASRLPFKGLGSAGGGQMLWGAPVSLPGFCLASAPWSLDTLALVCFRSPLQAHRPSQASRGPSGELRTRSATRSHHHCPAPTACSLVPPSCPPAPPRRRPHPAHRGPLGLLILWTLPDTDLLALLGLDTRCPEEASTTPWALPVPRATSRAELPLSRPPIHGR